MTTGNDLIMLFIGSVVMVMGFSLLTARGGNDEKMMKPPPPTVTEIQCDNPECEFKEIRDFEDGDYILKSLEMTCPKCQGSLTIQGVYVVREEPEDKIEV
jgi:hypothetical protein